MGGEGEKISSLSLYLSLDIVVSDDASQSIIIIRRVLINPSSRFDSFDDETARNFFFLIRFM